MKEQEENQVIPERVMKRYNMENCIRVTFTEKGLEEVKKKYKEVRGLPAFLHNTFRGRPTDNRNLFIEKQLFAWTSDFKAIIIPNSKDCEDDFRNHHGKLKDCLGGFSLLGWWIDSRLLQTYGWNGAVSFTNFLIANDNTQNVPPDYRFFNRTNSQKEIREIELISPQQPYLATILDLTPNEIDFLKNLQVTALEHLEKTYGVDSGKDKIEMYFHFPCAEATTTLHLHIRVNQGRHPSELARSFSLEKVIDQLERGEPISNLILERNPYYIEELEVLHTAGVYIEEAKNPHILISKGIFDEAKLNQGLTI